MPGHPAGNLHGSGIDLAVALGGTLEGLEDLGETPVRSGADGEAARVADLARLVPAVRNPPDQLALIDGRPGMVLALRTPEQVRVDLWNREVRDWLDEYRRQLPRGIDARVIFDQAVYTRDRLESLVGSLVLGLALVISVVVVVMGWRTALLVATTLPLTLGASLAVMNAFGVPINQISVSGLIIALGMLIDNAIIAVDGYGRRRRQGLVPTAAIEGSIGELGVPLLASTTTTVLAFMPLVLMPGNAGEFISGLGHAVVITLTLSLLISLTMVLAFAGLLDRGARGDGGSGAAGWSGVDLPRLQRRYGSLLEGALARPGLSLLVMAALPLAGFAAASQLVGQFFPATDRDQFEIRIQLAPGVGIERTRALTERIHARLDAEPGILSSHWFVGDQPPRVY
ncbi:MAG: efflux RND transporter permease subunit [Gammaproteobacteria bacterium]|nr:efflux RND transporter permease subunit [Gammaproteobacteria bacterium]